MATIGTPDALVSAVYDAVGVRIPDLPITPEKILLALKKKKTKEKRTMAIDSEWVKQGIGGRL